MGIRLRWWLAACVAFMIFGNHFSRDSVGALEKQMESDLELTPIEYGSFQTVYFLPNVIMPLVGGAISHKIGAARTLLVFLAISTTGHLIFAVGTWFTSEHLKNVGYPLLVAGRALQGVAYETIDLVPLPILAPYFSDLWGIISGLINAFVRLGS
eukprot:5015765-Pyramimonas_sp.AAC.1